MQVHDELLFEARSEALVSVASMVKAVMEGVVSLRVPLPVKMHVGPSWGDLQEFTIPSVGSA